MAEMFASGLYHIMIGNSLEMSAFRVSVSTSCFFLRFTISGARFSLSPVSSYYPMSIGTAFCWGVLVHFTLLPATPSVFGSPMRAGMFLAFSVQSGLRFLKLLVRRLYLPRSCFVVDGIGIEVEWFSVLFTLSSRTCTASTSLFRRRPQQCPYIIMTPANKN
jgi:hypothetical protein